MFRANQLNAGKIERFLGCNGANPRLRPRQDRRNQPLLRGQDRTAQAFRIARMRNGGRHGRQGAAAREKVCHHLAGMGAKPSHLWQRAFFGGCGWQHLNLAFRQHHAARPGHAAGESRHAGLLVNIQYHQARGQHIAFCHATAIAQVFGNDPAAWPRKARGDHMGEQCARSARRHYLAIQAEHHGKTRKIRGAQRILRLENFAAIKLG